MGTTPGLKTTRRRLRPAFDFLDRRLTLSASQTAQLAIGLAPAQAVQSAPAASTLRVVSTTPADSATLQASPTTLSVTFDRPIDDFTLGNRDFDLLHVAVDGTTSPLGPGEALLTEAMDPSDPTGRRISLSLDKPLGPGRYRLILDPSVQLMGLDGSSLATSSPGATLADFSFNPASGLVASRPDLGTLGSQEIDVPGSLDLSSNPGAVQYDQFELAPGHHWLVGLQVAAHLDGGTLDSSLSLFDARGNLIATSDQGLANDPSDPYLFEGLDPGTYYLGISAKRNVPSASGAYDLAGSTSVPPGSGGAYHLDLVADPADHAAQLLGLRVDRADPLSNTPTGLTLQFDSAIDVRTLSDPNHPGLSLVDRSGKAWPFSATSYDASRGQLTLTFEEPLPAGVYSLKIPGADGLVDLAGLEPTVQGLPVGTLGSFVVASANPPAGDLGPIFADPASVGLITTATGRAGAPATEQFTIIDPGVYAFTGRDPSGGPRFAIEDASGRVLASESDSSDDGAVDVDLPAGSYQVVFANSEGRGSTHSLEIRLAEGMNSSLLQPGVSQGPALNLRLVTPQADFGQGVIDVSSSSGPVAADARSTSTSGDGASSQAVGLGGSPTSSPGVGPSVATGPSVAGLHYGIGPAGSASSIALPPNNLGPQGASGPPGEEGLPGGSKAGAVAIRRGGPLAPGVPAPVADSILGRAGVPGDDLTLEAGLLARSPRSRDNDERTLADADRMGLLLAEALGWIVAGDPGPEEAGVGVAPVGLDFSIAGEPAWPEKGRVESASLISPLGLGVVLGAITYGYRLKVRRRTAAASSRPKILIGPHLRVRAHRSSQRIG